jgi:hypothetical protein
MTENERKLLLKDLCARQFYRTKVLGPWEKDGPCELSAIDLTYNRQVRVFEDWYSIDDVKPYLRPMSSMTEEEKKEHDFYCGYKPYDENIGESYLTEYDMPDYMDFLYEHHLDFRGLIPMGLALEAPADMYKFE